MKTLVIKGRDRLWPTVTWTGSNLSIQYLGSEDDDVTIEETNTIDFDEFFRHLDNGGSIFLTVKPDAQPTQKTGHAKRPVSGALSRGCFLNLRRHLSTRTRG